MPACHYGGGKLSAENTLSIFELNYASIRIADFFFRFGHLFPAVTDRFLPTFSGYIFPTLIQSRNRIIHTGPFLPVLFKIFLKTIACIIRIVCYNIVESFQKTFWRKLCYSLKIESRNYEKKKSEFQEEINKRTEEIRNLQSKKVEYEKNDNEAMALRTQAEITKKSDFLLEYTSAKNVELESMQKSMQSSDAFNKKLSETLAKIAESEGYSMILSLQQANAILWYSNSVDITDQIIKRLGL